jgi:hypothetical protein
LHGQTTTITGTAQSYSGSGLSRVEISINGSAWLTAAGTAAWSFAWTLPADGVYTIRSRATDILNNVESPGAGINVVVDNCGSPELQHYNWNPTISGQGCNACHDAASRFLPSGYGKLVGFCVTCHSPSGIGHDRPVAGRQHPVMVDISTNWTRRPTYGNVTASVNDNRAFARLKDGRRIVCVTCHNTMNKYEDFGRAWEFTTTADRKTYYLDKGGWSFMGSLKPVVYRSTSLWSGPTYSRDRKGYIVDPSEYTYDETAGTITFAAAQQATAYIYVTLDYPYLRVGTRNNALCLDCHFEATHKGANCLVCHQAHNTQNLSGIRGVVRTTDHSERPVRFSNITRAGSFADGNTTYDGICEVCHTTTRYYRRDGSGSAIHADGKNYTGKDCTKCHNHLYGFATSRPAATPVVVVALIPSATNAIPGETVTWTATASGGTGSYQYQFWRSGPDTGGAFVLARDWGASNKWPWAATAAMTGGNIIRVKAANSDGTGTAAALDYVTYSLYHQVLLSWSRSTSTALAGYKVYYGTASGKYTQSVAAGNVTTYTVGGLSSGVTYYFTLTLYDQYGNESAFSNEVKVTIP